MLTLGEDFLIPCIPFHHYVRFVELKTIMSKERTLSFYQFFHLITVQIILEFLRILLRSNQLLKSELQQGMLNRLNDTKFTVSCQEFSKVYMMRQRMQLIKNC